MSDHMTLNSGINVSHLPMEEAHVHTQRNETVITITGGTLECPACIFTRSLRIHLAFMSEHHSVQP